MSFLQQEPTTFINIKLTDTGRRLLSLGKLTFDQAVLSDREVNYGFLRKYSYYINTSGYLIDNNKIIGPKDAHPQTPLTNFDGSTSIPLVTSVFSSTQTVTAQTESTGFWSASTVGTPSTIGSYVLHPDRYILSGKMSSSVVGNFVATTGLISGATYPMSGQLIYFRAKAPIGSNLNPSVDYPLPSLWYRATPGTSGINGIDRFTPTYKTGNTYSHWYSYPFDGIDTHYGSAATINCPVWNLNIVRTSSEIGHISAGTSSAYAGITIQAASGFTTYASREFNGAKHYFGFGNDIRQVGFIHYSNEYTGNTYAEQLSPGSTEVDMPDLMWHRYPSNPGQAIRSGWRFVDKGSSIYYDEAARTNYTLLRDGVSTGNVTVGRVYFQLKIIAITDPELLSAMSYKANRNWTLPPPVVSLVPNPKPPLTLSTASGLCKSDKVYYVTYNMTNTAALVLNPTVSLGMNDYMHCGYVQRIEGYTDESGNNQFLSVTFPPGSFPYLRNTAGFTTYSGTGWSSNKIQIMVNEVDAANDNGVDNLSYSAWKLISSGSSGNGMYTGEVGHTTIDPVYLQSKQFILSQQDYNSGTTYLTNKAFFSNQDYQSTVAKGLTYGNEDFFFGNIKTKIVGTIYKTVINIVARDIDYNSSLNSTYDGTVDASTYITEIGIMNTAGQLVAVGKPTYPIKKSQARYLTFQLEIDF